MAELVDAHASGACLSNQMEVRVLSSAQIQFYNIVNICTLIKKCGCVETGIQARLRCVCRKAWRFESSHPHINKKDEKFIPNKVKGSPLIRTKNWTLSSAGRAFHLH